MAYEKELKKAELPHNVIIEGRERMSVSGVEDVESFDEASVVMYTSHGLLVVKGRDLHIEKLSLDGGELNIEGQLDSLQYEDQAAAKSGFLSRLFG